MCVEVRKRQTVNFFKGCLAHIADGVVRDLVAADIHQPLGERRAADEHRAGEELRQDNGKVDLFLADDGVDGVADEHRDVQRAQHADYGKCKQQNDGRQIRTDLQKNTFNGTVFVIYLAHFAAASFPPN